MPDNLKPDSEVASPMIDSARVVFLAWERLRLVYNAALACVVLVFAASELSDPAFRGLVARAAVGANICFCIGPVAEGYFALLGFDRRLTRWLIFVPGLLFSCLLALITTTFSWQLRNFD